MNQIKKKQKTKQWPHNKKTDRGGEERRRREEGRGLRPGLTPSLHRGDVTGAPVQWGSLQSVLGAGEEGTETETQEADTEQLSPQLTVCTVTVS